MKFNSTDYVIEPANVHTVRCVTTVNTANVPREVVLPPEGGSTSEIDYGTKCSVPDNYAVINKQNLTGVIRLKAGYNCGLSIRDNTIMVTAVPGTGLSVFEDTPSEVSVSAEEALLLQAGKYLSRGPKCYELIESINGLHKANIPIITGDGVDLDVSSGNVKIKLVEANIDKNCDLNDCENSLLLNS